MMPQDNDVLQMLADAALMSGRFGSASSALRALAKIQPGEPRIWAGLGHSYEALSEEAFAKLDSLAPSSPTGLRSPPSPGSCSVSFAALWHSSERR